MVLVVVIEGTFEEVGRSPAMIAVSELYKANPDCLMFGTDLPSTRAPRPFLDSDISIITDTLGEVGSEKVLFGNAYNFYINKHV